MDQCVRVAIESMDLSLMDAFRMASLTPATILGVSDRKGSLEAGKDADVVILDDDLRVAYTVARGRVFDVKSDKLDVPARVVEWDRSERGDLF